MPRWLANTSWSPAQIIATDTVALFLPDAPGPRYWSSARPDSVSDAGQMGSASTLAAHHHRNSTG